MDELRMGQKYLIANEGRLLLQGNTRPVVCPMPKYHNFHLLRAEIDVHFVSEKSRLE